MVKTFNKTKSGEQVKTGNVAIQPRDTTPDLQRTNARRRPELTRVTSRDSSQELVAKRGNSSSSNSPRDTITAISGGKQSKVEEQKRTIDAIKAGTQGRISSITSNTFDSVPANSIVGSGTNTILPNFGNVNTLKPDIVLPEQIAAAQPATDYENATGIVQDNAELVMALDFKPLFYKQPSSQNQIEALDDEANITPEGRMFFTQLKARYLYWSSLKRLYQHASAMSGNSTRMNGENFKRTLTELGATSRHLINLNSTVEIFKRRLDLRDAFHKVRPQDVLRHHYESSVNESSTADFIEYLNSFFNTNHPSSYNATDALKLLGFNEDNIKYSYTSTKIWLQMLFELKQILLTHSLSLLEVNPPFAYREDENPTKIIKNVATASGYKRFNISSNVSSLSLHEIKNTLMSINQNDVLLLPEFLTQRIADDIDIISRNLYNDVRVLNEEIKIAAVVNLVSKEIRFSQGLINQEVSNRLSENYSFAVNDADKNQNIFDFIIGNIATNVGESPVQPSSNSLAGIASKKINDNEIVLSLECKKLEGNRFDLIPGSQYYGDNVFSVTPDGQSINIENLVNFTREISGCSDSLNSAVADLGLLAFQASNTQEQNLNNPVLLFDALRSKFFDESEGALLEKYKNDPIVPVLAFCKNKRKTKKALLTSVILQTVYVAESILGMPQAGFDEKFDEAINKCAELLHEALLAEVQAPSAGFPAGVTQIRKLDIDECIKKYRTSPVLNEIVVSFAEIYNSLKSILQPSTQKTSFQGMSDLHILMMLFDVIVIMFDHYSGKKIVGIFPATSGNVTVYNIYSLNQQQNNRASIIKIGEKIKNEVVTSQQALLTVMSVLQKLYESAYDVVTKVITAGSNNVIRNIAEILDADVDLLKLFLNDGQIKLFANTVADTMSITNSNQDLPLDVTGDNAFNGDDHYKLLDDTVIFPKMRKQLGDFFKLPEFTSEEASGYKIFSFGFPIGFFSLLRQKFERSTRRRTSVYQYQNDVIKMKLYKVDVLNPDVIFKPKEYLFEMSRFPVRNETYIRNENAQVSKAFEVAKKFPMRDYVNIFKDGGAEVQYFGQPGDAAFAGSGNYPYLRQDQKEQIHTNHVISYLLEAYIRIMTSLSTAEHNLSVAEPPSLVEQTFVADLFLSAVDVLTQPKEEEPPRLIPRRLDPISEAERRANEAEAAAESTMNATSPTSFNGDVLASVLDTNPSAVPTLGFAADAASAFTTQSNPLAAAKKLVTPKVFDRVFNVIVDSNSFEIDRVATESTTLGRAALTAMLVNGDVVEINRGAASSELRYREKFISQGDLAFEKYFIVVETVDDEE